MALLARLPDEWFVQQLADRGFVADLERLLDRPTKQPWWERKHPEPDFLVAYFSMEFGLHESLPSYAGGLGILAGDHLKAAAQLGIPIVGVGLFYRRGYFRQAVDPDCRQVETYPSNDPGCLPMTAELTPGGVPLCIEVELGDELLRACIWRVAIGRVRLYLLDSDIEGNSDAGRQVTDILYGGDREHRLRQEILLGAGGGRALAALGLEPTVFHINEGHAAFVVLERVRTLVEAERLPFAEALERIRSSTVFTTHTPVPAGNERFPLALARDYLDRLARDCGGSFEELATLAAEPGAGPAFGMTEFALRTSARANAVSELHGAVARRMWAGIWPERRIEEVPIAHVTNAVHVRSWISAELEELLRSVGVRIGAAPEEQEWEKALELDDAALWTAHLRRKAVLLKPLGLDPECLTIGFARRFATYKRAGLLLSDPERLLRLVSSTERPLQIVFAGRAHPQDSGGKTLLSRIARFARDPGSDYRVVLLEDYDIGLARLLVQGVDVWLNTPRRLNEACGTSGMKAGVNGVLNLSILDGWWREGYAPEVGWAIDQRFSELGEEAEAAELLRLLEEEVVPSYYERGGDGLPTRWLEMMKASIASIGARFNAERMLVEYVERCYLPAHREVARWLR